MQPPSLLLDKTPHVSAETKKMLQAQKSWVLWT